MVFERVPSTRRMSKGCDATMRSFRALVVIVSLIGLGFCCAPMSAQVDISARLDGTVTDQTGAIVPNAAVVAHNVQTGTEAQATSNSTGYYQFGSLPAGNYTITCAVSGFKLYSAHDVVLNVGGFTTLPVKLQVGATSETVTVSGSAAMVDTVSANNVTTIDATLIDAIPVEGRDPQMTLQLLTPGATVAATGSNFLNNLVSFNGVQLHTNNFEVNGASMDDYFHGTSASAFPQSENISEFSVATTLPDASVGRGAGGQVEATMKYGTNEYHGQFWAYLQNEAWNANSWSNNFQNVARQPFHQEWYGGNVGGPVRIPKLYNGKDKTFFFTSYERTSISRAETTTGQTITNAERGGDFTNSPDGIPVINGVPTPIIPTSDFSTLGNLINSSAGKAILPAPTSGVDTFTWNPTFQDLLQTVAVRIDEQFNEKHRLFGSLWWYNDNPTFNDVWDVFGGPSASWGTQYPNSAVTYSEPATNQVWALNDTYSITPSMLNNFIVGVTRQYVAVADTWSSGKDLFNASNTGIGAVGDVASPSIQQITTPRGMGLGMWNGYTNPTTETTVDGTDNFTWTKGRHTIKTGLEIRSFREIFQQTWDSGGTVSFSDSNNIYGGTGNGIADMLIQGGVGGFYQNSAQNLALRYPAREAYAEDTYKVNQHLTVMLGLRLQPYFGVREAKNRFITFRPGQPSSAFPTAPTGLVTVGDSGIPPNLSGNVYNLGPRASFAWSFLNNGKAALKGGYGRYTERQYLIAFNSFSTAPPFGITYSPLTQGLSLATPYTQYGSVPFPYSPPTPGSQAAATFVYPNPLDVGDAIAPHYNSGQYDKFNVTFEIEPINTYVFSVAWVATRATHLTEQQNVNWPRFVPGGSTNDNANIWSREPYYPAGFSSIEDYLSDWNSMYNSLQVTANKRISHGLTLLGNYTYSSSVAQQGCRYYAMCSLDYFSPGAVHSMAAAVRYQLPAFQNMNRVSQLFVGGWAIGGTVNANTGAYGSVGDYNCAQYNFGSASCYANFTGGNPLLSSRGRGSVAMSGGSEIGVNWVDPSKFIRAGNALVNGVSTPLPGTGQRLFLGNATPGVFKGPASGVEDFNASLDKDFSIVENYKLNFHAEAFNALNHTVLQSPGYNNTVGPNTQGFGIISSANSPRNIQLSFHVIF